MARFLIACNHGLKDIAGKYKKKVSLKNFD
jgi:hypothetical protein